MPEKAIIKLKLKKRMGKILAEREREELKIKHRHERNGKICDRIKAMLRYDDSYSYAELAKILLLDETTPGRHVDDYLSDKKLGLANYLLDLNVNLVSQTWLRG